MAVERGTLELNEEFNALSAEVDDPNPTPVVAPRGVIVVGSHRSGTSALARVLSLVGCDLPKHVMPPLEGSNELGFWEPEAVVQAHEDFLAKIGSSWDDVAPLPDGAFISAAAVELRQQLSLLLRDEYGRSPLFVVKDPRISRLLPLWLAVLGELQIAPAIAIAVRNPLEVAASLKTRDGFTTTKSLLLWLRHTLESEQHSRGRPRSVVMYDELLRDWQGVLARVGEDLDLTWPGRSHRATVEIEGFLSEQHRHYVFDWNDLEGRTDVVKWVKEAYFALRASNPVPVLDQVRDELSQADTAFGPIVEEARLALEASREAVLEVAAARDALAAEAEARDAALAAREAEAREFQGEVERLAAAASASNERVAARQVEMDALRAQRDSFAREVEILAGEVERLAALADAAQSRAVAAESESAHTNSALDEARGEAARLGAEANESAARILALETEASADRGTSLAALEAARFEIEQLQEQVTAAQARAAAAEAQGVARADELRYRIEAAQTEIEQVGARARTAEEAAEATRSERDTISRELEILRAEVARLTAAVALAESVEARTTAERGVAQAELEAARTETRDLFERARDAQAAAQRLASELDETKAAAAQAELEADALLELADVEAEASRTERDRLQTNLAEAVEERGELLILVRRLEAALESASAALDEHEEAAAAAAAGSTAREAELEADRSRLLRQVEGTRSELEAKGSEADEARSELRKLKSEATSERAVLVAELESARSALERLGARSGELEAALEAERAVARALRLLARRRRGRRRTLSQLGTWLVRPTPRRLGYLRRYLFLRWSGEFDLESYLLRNPDVLEAGLNPLMHYVEYGRPEGRQPFVGAEPPPALESGEPDPLLASGGAGLVVEAEEAALPGTPAIAEETNDETNDLDSPAAETAEPEAPRPGTVLTDDLREALETEFDRDYYLGHHPDVGVAGMDPLEHYFYTGWFEGRDPSDTFSTSYYLRSNPDVAGAGINPLVHYVLAGCREGRRTLPIGGFRRQTLESLRSLDEEIEHWHQGLDSPPAPMDSASLRGLLAARIGTRRHVVVSCSHDDYTRVVGGVQLCVALEQAAFVERDCAYINLHPVLPLPILSRETEPEALMLAVLCGGEEIGVAQADAVIEGLAIMGAEEGVDFGLVVHALHGHSPEVIASLHRSLSPRWACLWLHDFFAICPSATLLRNRIEPCGAPASASPSCTICIFGEERRRHLPRIRSLLEEVSFQLVAPSAFMAERWSQYFDGDHPEITVHGHGTLALEVGSVDPPAIPRDEPVRVAFLGVPTSHKGWGVFLELVRRHSSNDDFRFFHFGDGRHRVAGVESREVHVGKSGPREMVAALRVNSIDLAIVWSVVEESFSFTAHEALAAGAAILTNEGSGNVARVAGRYGNGIVFANEPELFRAFEGGAVSELARSRRGRSRSAGAFMHSGMTADLAGFDD